MNALYAREDVDVAWCPGCGNFGILKLIEQVLEELNLTKSETVFVSGIGQAAKTPYYVDTNMFGVLHGRALPVATAIKAANPKLSVVAEGGDGDMYGEGGNHFLHAIRRNVNIVHIVHNNMVYGLTKGQASPTSQKEFVTKVQVNGVNNEPVNSLAIALSLKAGFVSRVNIGDMAHAKEVLKKAFLHKGYALVDIFQPCVTFNKINTYEWFHENTYKLDSSHDSGDFNAALQKAFESLPMPLGVLYQESLQRETFESFVREKRERPLYETKHDMKKIQGLFEHY